MKTIRDVLNSKGWNVHSLAPESSVYEALSRMVDHDIGALVVVDSGQPVGIVSERDYARKVALHGKFSRDTPVWEVMSSLTFSLPEDSVEEGMDRMTTQRVRHLVVIGEGRAWGIVSIGDLVAAVLSDQRFVIEQLERYIVGAPSTPPWCQH